jgi:hypothetical protein
MFLVHLGIILGYVVSKEGKLLDPKKNLDIIHMLTSKTPKDIQVLIAWHNITCVSSKTLLSLWLPLLSYCGRQKLLNGQQSANMLGKKSSNNTWMH